MTFVYAATVVPRVIAGSCSSESSRTTRASGPRPSARSTSGDPMFPPSVTGWTGSAARIAAASDEVVVFPFVPVTPTVGARQSRRKRSGSLTSGASPPATAASGSRCAASARRRSASAVGKAGFADGEKQMSAAPSTAAAGSTSGPRARATRRPSSASIAAVRSAAGFRS